MDRHPNFFVTDWYIFEVVWEFFIRMLCASVRISSPCFSFLLVNTSVNILYLL